MRKPGPRRQYLAVELAAKGVSTTKDCGGQRLTYDVVATTYSLLLAGVSTGIDDGIEADPQKVGGATFPYLAAAP